MEAVAAALARIDAIRAMAPPPRAPLTGFAEVLATAVAEPAAAPAAAGPVTLGEFVAGVLPRSPHPVAPAFVRPLAAPVGSAFGMRRHPILDVVRMHNGVDMGAPTGTPIRAFADGVVSFAGDRGGYGNVVYLDHADGLQTRYAHQSGMAVSAGDRVAAGQVIGYVGSTGLSTGPHLHFELRRDGEPIDPAPFLEAG